MTINKTLFILGQQKSMLQQTQSILQDYFAEIRTFTDVDEFLNSLHEVKPQFILFGGAITEAIRVRVKDEVARNNLQIKFIEPRAPSEILSATLKLIMPNS